MENEANNITIEDAKKEISLLKDESAKRRIANKELTDKYTEMSERLQKFENDKNETSALQKAEYEEELKSKSKFKDLYESRDNEYKSLKEQYEKHISEIEQLQNFKDTVINSKLEKIKDEDLRKKLIDVKDIELIDKILALQVQQENSIGSNNGTKSDIQSLKNLTLNERVELANTNPDLYNKLVREASKG